MKAEEIIKELEKIYPSKFIRAIVKGKIIIDVGNTAVVLIGKRFKYFGKIPQGFSRCGVSVVYANDDFPKMLENLGITLNVLNYE